MATETEIVTVEQWLEEMRPNFLSIKDVKNMQHNEENEYLCICRNFYDFLPDITKEDAIFPHELFKNNYKMHYIHDRDLKGKTKYDKEDEYINFEFHIEYKKDLWYPLKDGKLPLDDPQGVFKMLSNNDVKRDWVEYDENTNIGWRGPMLNWKYVEDTTKKLYNC